MLLRVQSFDADGCLFNWNYLNSKDKDVVNHNQALINRIKLENHHANHTITMVGSLRQSKGLDDAGSELNRSGSCFPAIQSVATALNSVFDPLLLADIFGDLPTGESLRRAITGQINHAVCIGDESKLIMLYVQMHHVATAYPDASIIFDFYDDRGRGAQRPRDILEHLSAFFTMYPQMMPSHVTLQLNHYAGEEVSVFEPIRGTGHTDKYYRQTMIDMVDMTPSDSLHYGRRWCVAHVKPELLTDYSQVPPVFMDGSARLIRTIKSKELGVEMDQMKQGNFDKTLFISPAPIQSGMKIERSAKKSADEKPSGSIRPQGAAYPRRTAFFVPAASKDEHSLSELLMRAGLHGK